MKTFIFLLCCVTVASAQTQSLDTNAEATNNAINPITQTIVGYQQGTQAANQNVLQKIVQITDAQGNVTYQTNNAYTELATGLNYLVNGQWMASKEEIDIAADGNSALATNGQHQAYFPGDIYSGQIELVTPDGKQLFSRPVGLSYFDGTNSVLIAELTNSIGEVVGNNQVIYTNAFTDFGADIRYTYTKAGFEQDIILREQPPTPASFGLNPATTRLQVLTEFFDPPQPTVSATTVPTGAGDLEDDFLDFGVMQMIPGKAFLLGTTTPSVGVNKQWLLLDGRQLLVEEVSVVSIADDLEKLPLPQTISIQTNPPLNVVSVKRLLPTQRIATVPSKHPMQIAQVTSSSRGLVLDYVTMTSQTNYTFQGDTTYYISGTVNLYQTNTFEGGAVLKYTNNASLYFENGSVLNWKAAAYRPVIFTAKDDNSVGDNINGSTGSPTNYYANPALSFNGTNSLSYFRIAWASQAISANYYGPVTLYHGQVVNCLNGITCLYGNLFLRNLLFANVLTNFNNISSSVINVQNTTFSGSTCLVQGPAEYTSPTLTNCIFANVTSLTAGTVSSFSGTSNGFYICQEFGTSKVTNNFYPFQSVGGGNYYLTNGCAFTNAGTASIDPTLLVSLQQKTTYPPLLLTNQTISANTNLNPQAMRDTNATPSLGYHYDPIDYIVDLYAITNATLTVTNGTAIASYNESGIQLQNGSSIVSIGSPLYPNWFVRYTSVQEGTNLLGGTSVSSGITVSPSHSYTSVGPTGQYQFSKFACPAGCGYLFDASFSGTSTYSNLLVQNCELWSGQNDFSGNSYSMTILQNNLFDRSSFTADPSASTSLWVSNNLFFGVTVLFWNRNATNTWQAFNNSFDSCIIDYSPSATYGHLTNGYNAYLNCTGGIGSYMGELWPTNASDIVTNATMAYQTNWLGSFYQPTNSPLIRAGSTNANLVGLYHYTVTTNEVIEGTNIVSIGYHYVATDTNGIPLDSNGDGIPDYLEDANGNGIVDNGEANWGLAILTQPVSQTVVQGTNVTFSVTADGVAPLIFQWYFNGTNLLAGATNSSITISNVQPANVGSYQLVVTNFTGSLTSSAATLTLTCDGPPSGLVGWWRGESNALDSAGVDNGIVTNGISYTTPGEVGTAFNFDGTNGFIQIPNAPDLEPTNLTIEAWVRVSSLYSTIQGGAPSGEQFIVEKPNSYGFDGYVLYIYPNGSGSTNKDYFAFGINNTNDFPPYVGSASGILSNGVQTNVWYHVAGVRGSNNGTNYIQLYVNGQTSAAWTTNIGFQQTYGNYPLFLGSSGATDGEEGVGWNALLKGDLDEVSLYNRALSSSEIVAIYDAGTNGKCLLANLTVNLTTPTNGQPLLARSNVTVTATVDSSIPGTTTNWVQFFANTTNDLGWALINTNGTYQVTWIPPVSGTNVLTAFVTNSSGLTAWSSPVTVYVRGLPTVTITNPITGSVFGPSPVANITLKATATGDGASITNVTYYQGTNILGTITSSPFNFTNWNNVASGTYSLTAKATDSMGATSVSFPVQITVNVTNQSPQVYAGPNQTTNLTTAQLAGAVTDDGLLSNYLYVAWSRTNGPGTVTFGNSNQPVTTVTFSTNGTNVFQLTATDGQLTSNSYVTVVMVSNAPPTVYAGSNQTNICPVATTNFVVHLTPVATVSNTDSIIGMGVDYFIPSNSVMYSENYTNTSQIFEMLSSANGSSMPFDSASMTNLSSQYVFATVKDTNGGFSPGEIFTGNGNPGEIMLIRPDGNLVGTNGINTNAWVAISNENGQLTGGTLYVDRTGIFGGNLIAVFKQSDSGYDNVYRINAAGQATFLAQILDGSVSELSAVITLPNDTELYGPWAGKILFGYSWPSSFNSIGNQSFFTVDTNGFIVSYDGFEASGLSIIPPNENLYTVDAHNGIVWGTSASKLQGVVGNILMTDTEQTYGNDTMFAVRWNGQAFVKTMVAVADGYDTYNTLSWSQVAFAPAGISNVPPSPYSVQLNGLVSDDGHIWSATSNTWVQVNGPGPVSFADATQTNTIASYIVPGTYVLRLIANDGEFTRYDDVTNYIIQNQAPVVSGGTNQVVPTTNATLSVSVSDDGWPSNQMTITWSKVSGPGTANFSWQTTNTTTTNFIASPSVNFTTSGTYILQLTASDGQASASTNVTITVATPQLILTPAYSGPFVAGSIQTVTATLLATNGVVISNAVVQFIVTGVDSVTNLGTTDTNGMAQFTYTNADEYSIGRDLIQASFTNGSQIVTSQPAIIDWGINIDPSYEAEQFSVADGLSTDMPTNELRYATYFIYTNGQAGTTLTVQFSGLYDDGIYIGDDPMLLYLKNSSNHVVASSAYDSSDIDSYTVSSGDEGSLNGLDIFSGSLVYTLPVSGNYIIELTTAETNDTECYYNFLFSTNAPDPEMVVLLNGTNLPSGLTLNFGTTLTNVSVTNLLIITNENSSELLLTNPQVNGDFQSYLGTNDVPANSSIMLTNIFKASSNETSVGSLVISNNFGAPYALTFIGSAFPPGTPPAIQLISPTNFETFFAPAVIPITALAQPGSNAIGYVSFQASYEAYGPTNGNGVILLGTNTSPPYTLTWLNVPNGDFFINATAVDSVGRSTTASPVLVHVLPSSGLTPPVAVNYQLTVLANSVNNILNPLGNDSDTNYNVSLTIVSNTTPQFGSATVINNGQAISYTPNAGVRGYDNFSYEITDGQGGTAWASVAITISGSGGPSVIITNPPDQYSVTSGVTVPLVAYVTPSQNIAEVDFYIGENLVGEATNGPNGFYTNSWTAVCANDDGCVCPVVASATDIFGQTGTSPQTHINVIQSTGGALYTSLANIVDANGPTLLTNMVTIREGLFNVYGQASNSVSDSISWQLGVYTLDGTLVRDLTPSPNSAGYNTTPIPTNTDLAACDLTTLMNGVYILRLTALGNNQMTDTDVQFILESNLKIGQFSFSQQDLTIPVKGIPLTVTRTYNSLDSDQGDFGYGWTYSLSDMDVSIDQTRQNVTDGDGQQFSECIDGGQDVTLTLPNGQRTTFYYYLDPNSLVTAQPMWRPAPGVTATLTAQGSATFYDFSGLDASYLPFWSSGDDENVPDNNMDFLGYILKTQDGTVYYINRQDLGLHFINNGADDGIYVHAYGSAYLSEIKELSGDTITINSNSIVHTYTNGVTNSIVFLRNAQGLIRSISDPNEQAANGPASVIYQYDSNNNLINVLNLVNASGIGTYVTNSFAYANVNFPHYITGIFNADGTQVAKNIYDDSGKLTEVDDANGNRTLFGYNTTNDTQTVIDRLGKTNTYVYDLRGNVLAQTNALNQVTTMAYDANNNKTNEVTFLNGSSYATSSYIYDTTNELLSSTDPLGHTNGFAYDSYGNLLINTDSRGHSTTNNYDSHGNLTNTSDALGNKTINNYNNAGLLASSIDPLGNTNVNYYDSSDNLTGSALFNLSGAILSSNTFTYDADDNRLTSTVWRRVSGSWTSATTTNIYDAMNRVTQTIDPDGGTNTVNYDPTGKQQSTIDPLGRTTSYTYDAQGRLIQTAYPDFTTETNGYDSNGNRTNSVDRLNRVTTYVYDALNRLTQTIYPDNTTNTTVYDGVGRVAQTIDARGTITAFAYDAAGRRLAVTNALGSAVQNISSYSYDNDGNQITFTDSNNHTTTNVFDALNRQVQMQYPDGTATSTIYDTDGRRIAGVDQAGITNGFGYDGAGRLTTVTNALSKVTSYQYDEAGNEIAQIDALGRANSFVYDGMGRRIAHMMPTNALVERFNYDLAGNMNYDTNFNGVIITNQYDALNRLTKQTSTNGYQVSYTYTPTGQRATMTDMSGMTSYSYDNRDRLLLKEVVWSNGPTVLLNYRYDSNGNVTNLWSSTANGVTNNYQYDALNRLTNVKADGSAAASYTFDNAGNLQAMQYGNGVTNLYQYDSLNRLTNLTWKLTTTTLGSFYYQLGSSGNRTNLNEKVGIGATTRTYAWQYDNLYRLTNENISALGNLGYGYDSVGNRTNRTSSISGLTGQTPTYNTNDWLTGDSYDNNGNTTNSGVNYYQYDVMNHITNVNNGTILITYDGDGNRASKKVGGTTTYYLLDDRNPSGYVQVLEEYQGSSLSKVYNYGLDLISQRVPTTSTNYFIYDGHGSTRILTDNAGSVANVFAYDAYGTLIASNSTPQTAYLYCGQQFDFDLGLYLNRARYWNTGTGRFWTSDDDGYGNNEDPLNLHKYLYGADNPVNRIDPSGHDDLSLGSVLAGSSIGAGIDGAFAGVTTRAFSWAAFRTITAAIAIGAEIGGDRGGSQMLFHYDTLPEFQVTGFPTGTWLTDRGDLPFAEALGITYQSGSRLFVYAVAIKSPTEIEPFPPIRPGVNQWRTTGYLPPIRIGIIKTLYGPNWTGPTE